MGNYPLIFIYTYRSIYILRARSRTYPYL